MVWKLLLYISLGLALGRLTVGLIHHFSPSRRPYGSFRHLSRLCSGRYWPLTGYLPPSAAALKLRFLWVELCVAALSISCCLIFKPYDALKGLGLIVGLMSASIVDFDHQIIPDPISIGGMFAGLLLAAVLSMLPEGCREGLFSNLSLSEAFLGAAVGSSLLMWLGFMVETVLQREAIGFGDVKLMGFIGSFCGWKGALVAILGGSVAGTIILSLVWALSYPLRVVTGSKSQVLLQFGQPLPFGPWLMVGALAYYVLQTQGGEWLSMYFSIFELGL